MKYSITPAKIESLIYVFREQKIILDSDLANLYEIETGSLNRAVKRNLQRFPKDFMFQLTHDEFEHLKCQFGTSSSYGGRRTRPYAFTENGVAMLSSVLTSDKAIQINIYIIRTFTKIRTFLQSEESLTERLNSLEEGTSKVFRIVFDRLEKVESQNPTLPNTRRKIGLNSDKKNK